MGNRQRCLFSSLLCNIVPEEDIKDMQIGKEEITLPLIPDDMVVYVENSKEPTKKLIELISSSRQHDIRHTCKIQLHCYISNKHVDTKTKKHNTIYNNSR